MDGTLIDRTGLNSDSDERGCGYRMAGGIYLEATIGNDESGEPFAGTIVCPPAPVDVQALGLSPIGVKLIAINGTYHVFDWVGSNNYEHVADFMEEAYWMGISRRIAKTADFGLLTPESRLILIHSRAGIVNAAEMRAAIGHPFRCPAGREPDHDPACIGLSYHDFDQDDLMSYIAGHRQNGGHSYRAEARPDGFTPVYTPAIFMSVPISQIAVVRDDIGRLHEDALSRLTGARVPVTLVDR